MTRFRTIIVGLGAMGSAAAYHLAKRGHRVLGIDRHSPPHALGSSHGDTRITRLAIGEGEHFTPLAIRSHALWRELEEESGATLMTRTGGLVISSPTRGAALHVADFFANTVAAALRHGIAHELLDARALRLRFPQFSVAAGEHGYLERDAGFLRPESCVRAHLERASRRGAEIHRGETMTAFDAAPGGVTVATDRDRYTADRLIVAAGSWLPQLVDVRLARHFKVYRQQLFWFDVDGEAAAFAPGTCPVFIWELQQRARGLYGFPAVDGPRGGVKVGTEQFALETTAQAPGAAAGAAEIAAFHAEQVAPFVPSLSSRCTRSVSCLYTVTPDFGFVVDAHPDSERVLIVAPCSGHGFKHSPAIGEAVAGWAQDGAPPFPADVFGLARFEATRTA